MDDIVTVEEMIERIKDYLSPHTQKCPQDQDVAGVLRINVRNLATMKKRNKIPFKEVILFCKRTGLDPMKILI
ncbi:MAG: hypothetical protein Q8M43_01250 [Sulfuricurvum sp.]|uniref:hypothetical protein n=1 Tax=Sulfuricurvum sp. TaxID=2025608 RepID=UPI0027363673|nr:hypothetical protein [Sulfuricurvum sp.]MDP3290638.1 hypothetical protein [Sulfuricurvum sp.]